MIDYNRKLSNERGTQVPSQRMSILVLLYKSQVQLFFDYNRLLPNTID